MSNRTIYHALPSDTEESQEIEKSDMLRWANNARDGSSTYRAWARLVFEVILMIIVFLLSLKVISMHQSRQLAPYQGPNDPKMDFGFTDRVFMNATRYANEQAFMSEDNLAETLSHWVSLSSTGRGYVEIPESERDSLNGPPYLMNPLLRPNKKELYMLSGLHQLHCLATIMRSYGNLRLGKDEAELGYHIAHCFDYLRQGIICAGDTTLEGNNSAKYPGAEIPWGTAHRCVDWNATVRWADEHTVFPFPPGMDKIL